MDKTRELNLIISNLDLIAHKANELILGRSKNVNYPDFYRLYNSYISYLDTYSWENQEITTLIVSYPKIYKPVTRYIPYAFFILATLGILGGPFGFIGIILLCLLLFPIGYLISYLIKGKNHYRLSEIIVISKSLILRINETKIQ